MTSNLVPFFLHALFFTASATALLQATSCFSVSFFFLFCLIFQIFILILFQFMQQFSYQAEVMWVKFIQLLTNLREFRLQFLLKQRYFSAKIYRRVEALFNPYLMVVTFLSTQSLELVKKNEKKKTIFLAYLFFLQTFSNLHLTPLLSKPLPFLKKKNLYEIGLLRMTDKDCKLVCVFAICQQPVTFGEQNKEYF